MVLEQVAHGAVEHAGRALGERGGVVAVEALPGGFCAVQLHGLVVEEGVKDAHGVGTPAHAGRDGVGRLAALHLAQLFARLRADDAMEIADHHGIGVRAHHRADDVERVVRVRDPVANGLARGLLERLAAGGHLAHLRAQQLHPLHVEALSFDVLGAHVDDAVDPKLRADRGGGHAVLPRARLGDDALLAHARGQHDLADRVVDLVRTRVAEVLPLGVDARAADLLRQTLAVGEGRRTADVLAEVMPKLFAEVGIVLVGFVRGPKFFQNRRQDLGHERAAVVAEVAGVVGGGVRRRGSWGRLSHEKGSRYRISSLRV